MSERGSEALLIDLSGPDYWVGVSLTAAAEVKEGSDRVWDRSAASHPPTTPPAALSEVRSDEAKNPITHLRWSIKRYNEKPG